MQNFKFQLGQQIQKEKLEEQLSQELKQVNKVNFQQGLVLKNRILLNFKVKQLILQEKYDEALLLAVGYNSIIQFNNITEKYNQKINLEYKDKQGNTALNIATQSCHLQIFYLLIKKGADVNTQNNEGNTPLHYTLQLKLKQQADFLIKNGASQQILNNKGFTCWEGI